MTNIVLNLQDISLQCGFDDSFDVLSSDSTGSKVISFLLC